MFCKHYYINIQNLALIFVIFFQAFLEIVKREREAAEKERIKEEEERRRKREEAKQKKVLLEAAFDGDLHTIENVLNEVSDIHEIFLISMSLLNMLSSQVIAKEDRSLHIFPFDTVYIHFQVRPITLFSHWYLNHLESILF